MGAEARVQKRSQSALPRIVQVIASSIFSRSTVSFVVGAVLTAVLKRIYDLYRNLKKVQAESLWRRHVDFSSVQACVLSTEHLKSLGRVEKRTLFVKPISEVFRNEYILARLIEAAQKAAASDDPVLLTKLSPEDKWHVLNTCTNNLSACFAPYHIFFNEARRAQSYYKSAWYCFTLTCEQTEATGRWFITPMKPVGEGDCGSLRIRIVLMNEQELREIASGDLEAPATMFNGRHESRWQTASRFAELFQRQLTKVRGPDAEDWGQNLCGSLRKKGNKAASSNRLVAMDQQQPSTEIPEYEPEDNSILRIHIPFPTSQTPSTHTAQTHESAEGHAAGEYGQDEVAKDVVLFE